MLSMLATCAKRKPHYRKICMAYNSSVQGILHSFSYLVDRQKPWNDCYQHTQTIHEYAVALTQQMDKAFTLARQHSLTNHILKKRNL